MIIFSFFPFLSFDHPTLASSLYIHMFHRMKCLVKAFTTKMLQKWIKTQFCYRLSLFFQLHFFSSSNRRSLYTQIFDMKKPLVKTFEGVYIVVEPEDDSCWKKCLSRLYSSHHVHPTAAKQKTVHPSRFLGRNINVSVAFNSFVKILLNFFAYWRSGYWG